ncbi:MAG: lipopolysaccharide heptosyltransferase II [Pseudohongiellaceae bacterium]
MVGPSWIGDMVMAQSLFRVLRDLDPGIEISVLASEWSLPLLERMPEVDHRLKSPFKHGELSLAARFHYGRSLRGKFDCAIVLPNSFKSALVPWFAGIPKRVGWRGELRNLLLNDCRKLDESKLPLMVQRFVALARPVDAPATVEFPWPRLSLDAAEAERTRAKFDLPGGSKILVICPGAEFGQAKQWPASHFAALSEKAIAEQWCVWIIGSANDKGVAVEIARGLSDTAKKHCLNLAGQTTLKQAINLISRATAVVSNDSGLMHIAAALDKPVVALYGSTSPDFTPPLADKVKLLFTDIDCRPCFQRQCPLGHLRCLTELAVDRVYRELQDLLAY